jgi:hypothetical protein
MESLTHEVPMAYQREDGLRPPRGLRRHRCRSCTIPLPLSLGLKGEFRALFHCVLPLVLEQGGDLTPGAKQLQRNQFST